MKKNGVCMFGSWEGQESAISNTVCRENKGTSFHLPRALTPLTCLEEGTRGGFKRGDLGGREQKEHHRTKDDPLIRREIKCNRMPSSFPRHDASYQPHGQLPVHQALAVGSSWCIVSHRAWGFAERVRIWLSSLILPKSLFSIWLSLTHGSQSPLAHDPETMLLMLKHMVVWGCIFSLEVRLLFCFVLDIYGAEQREDHFPV